VSESLQTRERAPVSQPPERPETLSLVGLLLSHKRVSAAILAIVIALVGIIVASDLTSRVSRIGDSTPCSVWGATNQAKRDAYAALYLRQHGPLPSGASDAGTIEGVIDNGCTQAFGFDEADTVTVLQAIRHQY
jgi:hypothetical protein